jgi:hypothetical protein
LLGAVPREERECVAQVEDAAAAACRFNPQESYAMSDIPSASNSPSFSSSSPAGGDTVERLREEANRRAREFERQSEDVPGSLQDQARSAGQSVREEASSLASDLKSRARDYAESGKSRGTERLDSLAGAVERAASEIENESPETARFIKQAAQGTQRFSSRIRDRSVDDLVSDARDVARKQPLLVFGGAIVAGLVIARFLKSSRDDRGRQEAFRRDDSPYGGRSHDYE